MRICHPRLDLRHTLPQMPPNAPRVTFFATKQLEGDVSRVDFVSLEGFRGSYSRQMARKNPRATGDATRRAKGEARRREVPQGRIWAVYDSIFGVIYGTRMLGRPEGQARPPKPSPSEHPMTCSTQNYPGEISPAP